MKKFVDLDVIYHDVLDGFALNDTSGKILIMNLTSTSGYDVLWEVYDNVTGISHEDISLFYMKELKIDILVVMS